MNLPSSDHFPDRVIAEVAASEQICVAVDKHLQYIALNEVACQYLRIKPEDLLGRSAIQAYPEIIASRNHRNILRALSGEYIESDIVESRMGDLLQASYTPVLVDNEIKAVILRASIHITSSNGNQAKA